MAEFFVTGFKLGEPDEGGELVRLVFDTQDGDLELHMPTAGLSTALPLLAKTAEVAKLKADQSATVTAQNVDEVRIAHVNGQPGALLMLDDRRAGTYFRFYLTPEQTRQTIAELQMVLDK